MREIKFRLWDKLGNKIVTPNKIIYLNLLGQVVTDSPENGEIIPFSKDTYELNQSTGLQDVTGKDIYEGDIISDPMGIGQIVFDSGSFCIKWNDNPNESILILESELLEIIGNLFETPELLKV